jgi:FAD/FMN-containing dehydrogenase
MKLTGWGKYPVTESEVLNPLSADDVLRHISDDAGLPTIARGLGRSYGDSSLAPRVIRTTSLDHFLAFDAEMGSITCAAGVSLADILTVFVPKGWFLPVTPGTKHVTVGGAIASDVHGKNHHLHGTFCEHVLSLKIATVSSGIVECSRDREPELFHATCGGMGLTGVILEATFNLIPITSAFIDEKTIKAESIVEAIELFECHRKTTYSVAWIDCLSTGKSLGRSLLMLGEHSSRFDLTTGKPPRMAVPIDMPGFLLNRFSIQAFNAIYYNRSRSKQSERSCHYESFFYPLDIIEDWNRMYGRNGFTQYQVVLPLNSGLEGITALLQRISESKRASFLAVLKTFGPENDNYLSFPFEGYTLALDFKLDSELFEFLNNLDDIVLHYGGRLYMTKDSRMSETMFKQSYPRWQDFMKVRTTYGASNVFSSLQSDRLGL